MDNEKIAQELVGLAKELTARRDPGEVLDTIFYKVTAFYEDWDEGQVTEEQTVAFLKKLKQELRGF